MIGKTEVKKTAHFSEVKCKHCQELLNHKIKRIHTYFKKKISFFSLHIKWMKLCLFKWKRKHGFDDLLSETSSVSLKVSHNENVIPYSRFSSSSSTAISFQSILSSSLKTTIWQINGWLHLKKKKKRKKCRQRLELDRKLQPSSKNITSSVAQNEQFKSDWSTLPWTLSFRQI